MEPIRADKAARCKEELSLKSWSEMLPLLKISGMIVAQ